MKHSQCYVRQKDFHQSMIKNCDKLPRENERTEGKILYNINILITVLRSEGHLACLNAPATCYRHLVSAPISPLAQKLAAKTFLIRK